MIFSIFRHSWCSRLIGLCLMVSFVMTMVISPRSSYAQGTVMGLPQPGNMVNLSPAYMPLMVTGLTVHPENPLLMDFIVSTGNSRMSVNEVKKESDRLIKYFLACLTIPENNQWVNLSPYEKQRIIPQDLGQTVLGQDMLAQDYLLKQLTASLIYPEKNLGRNFWENVYTKARLLYGTTEIPVNTFNKVWILPDTAKVFEHNNTVFVVKSHLKVMLDEDYLAMQKHSAALSLAARYDTHSLGANIIRQIILPAIEQEVNKGKNFAQLRQIYNSMILAVWFKKNLKEALLNEVYTDRSKVNGVNTDDPAIKEEIYNQYLQAYKKGVFNYIKEEVDPINKETVARKYFSGGLTPVRNYTLANNDEAMVAFNGLPGENKDFRVSGLTQDATGDFVKNPKTIITPLTQKFNEDTEDDDGPENTVDRATMSSVDGLLRVNPALKVATDADQIRNWVSPHQVKLPVILNSVIKEYDIRGYDGGDDQKFPTQIDDILWKWFGRELGSLAYTSQRHQKTVSLEPGDFYLIAGDNGPSTGGLGLVHDKAGKQLPNVIDAISNGLMDSGVNVINLSVVGSGALYSTVADLMDELKKNPEKLRQTLEEAGIKLTDEDFENLKRVKGGLYVTRSHVEIGTNGAKPNIDGITLYGDMLQAMKPYILNGIYREVGPAMRGKMFKNDWMRETALDIYERSIKEQFGSLKASLDKLSVIARSEGKPVPQVIVNFSGGALAATKRANGEKFYLKLFQDVLGDHLKGVLRPDSDTWNENGGLADPTRLDAIALGNPKADIVDVSVKNPDDIILNFDLDADRISVLQNGRLFLGDEMDYPVIEYQLTLDPYAVIHRTQVPIYFDSRMKSEFAAKVRKHGGLAKIHPKGHSKVKATIDVDFMKLVNSWAASTGHEATKEAYLKAHPGFKIVQAEYSTHMFMTDTRGNAFDDAVRFGLFWLQAFAEIQVDKQKPMTIAEYIQADKDDPKKPLPDSKQLKEQRTSVSYIDAQGKIVPVSDDQKRALIFRMTGKVKSYFANHADDFDYVPDWQKYRGNNKPFTLVDVEGVYHLFINKPKLEGEIFWGWSNTSNKVAFGTQSSDAKVNKQLAAIAVALLVESRNEMAAETGLNWIKIEDLETKALSDLFGGLKAADIESRVMEQYPNASAALAILNIDNAVLAKTPEGGIDLNSRYIKMESSGQKMSITFDPSMVTQFRRGNFSGVRFQILDVAPVNLTPLFGLKEDELAVKV